MFNRSFSTAFRLHLFHSLEDKAIKTCVSQPAPPGSRQVYIYNQPLMLEPICFVTA
jgi:hypothetical protein